MLKLKKLRLSGAFNKQVICFGLRNAARNTSKKGSKNCAIFSPGFVQCRAKTTDIQTGNALTGLNVVKNKSIGEAIKQLVQTQEMLKVKNQAAH